MSFRETLIAKRNGTAMFDPQLIRTITLYATYTDSLTGLQIAIRCPLNGAVWDADSEMIRQQSGVNTTLRASCKIPFLSTVTGREFITETAWNNLTFDEIDAMTIQITDTVIDLTDDMIIPVGVAVGDKIRNVADHDITVGDVVMPSGDFGKVVSLDPFMILNRKYWTVTMLNNPLVSSLETEHEFVWALPTAANRLLIQVNNFLGQADRFRILGMDDKTLGSEYGSVKKWMFGGYDSRHIVLRV